MKEVPGAEPCPWCGKLFARSMRQCPFCAGERKMRESASLRICPRCGSALEAREWRKARIDVCPSCSGVWLGSEEFRHATNERDVFRDDSIPDDFVRKPAPHETGYLKCPVCSSLMPRMNFKRISGVLVDMCRDHGVWLDAGELQQIRSFIANGGLDEVRDKEILAQHEEIASLNTRVRDTEFMETVLHPWKLKRWIFRNI
jgi:Zn-finger nucleic acid-binding protein